MPYENGAFYVCRSIRSFCFQFVLLVEQVGVSASPREWNNLDVGVLDVYEQPVRSDVALVVAFVVAVQLVVAVLLWKGARRQVVFQ